MSLYCGRIVDVTNAESPTTIHNKCELTLNVTSKIEACTCGGTLCNTATALSSQALKLIGLSLLLGLLLKVQW